MRRIRLLVVGTADWNQPIATNQHYMVRELSKADDVSMVFSESLGLRRPEIKVRDLRRIISRLMRPFTRSVAARRPIPANVQVVSPFVLPYHAGIFRRFNSWSLRRSVGAWLKEPTGRVLWTYSPVTYGLEDHSDVAVYHCVDLLGTVPGIDGALIERAEVELARKGITAIASSDVVRRHLLNIGFEDVLLWENVADTEAIQSHISTSDVRDPKAVIFAGNLAPNKVDFGLLRAVVEAGFHLRLAGPVAQGGGSAEGLLAELTDAGATYLGTLSVEELGVQMSSTAVGLIPYLQNDYTRGVSPLKTYEYLAAGLAVVATDLPGVAPRPGDVWVAADGSAQFVASLHEACASVSHESIERRRLIAERHSWSARGEQARILLREAQESMSTP